MTVTAIKFGKALRTSMRTITLYNHRSGQVFLPHLRILTGEDTLAKRISRDGHTSYGVDRGKLLSRYGKLTWFYYSSQRKIR